MIVVDSNISEIAYDMAWDLRQTLPDVADVLTKLRDHYNEKQDVTEKLDERTDERDDLDTTLMEMKEAVYSFISEMREQLLALERDWA